MSETLEGVVGPKPAGERDDVVTLTDAPLVDAKSLNDAWRSSFKARKQKEKIAVVLMLPSGERVAVVRMPLTYMLNAGHVPDRLTSIVQRQIELLTGGDPEASKQKVMEEYAADPKQSDQEWEAVLNFIVMDSVVLPKFVADDEANPDHEDHPTFPISSMDLLDKIYLYEWNQGVNETVEAFLRAASETLGTVADGLNVSLSPEQLLRPDQPGGYMVGLPD